MERRWVTQPLPDAAVTSKLHDLPPVLRQLLVARGITDSDAATRFLYPDYARDVHDPFLFRDMEKAVRRLFDAIARRELITIHGDYDSDGICAAAILDATISALGGRTSIFLPHREEDGYGLNSKTVARLILDGTKVLITCDCGISNGPEIAEAANGGIDVIITDHHTIPPELPTRAFAIIHPKVAGETYPWNGLAGGGVAFKLAQALIRSSYKLPATSYQPLEPGFEKWLLDLVAISSVADMVPLKEETRALVQYGLIVLNKGRRMGLRKLMEAAGITPGGLDAHSIGFQIAPRINAAGRMEHARIAYQLLRSDDESEASALADRLNDLNRDRQKATERILAEAKFQIVKEEQDKHPALFVAGENWPIGVLGLIAGRLADEFGRPAFAMTMRDGTFAGSGRSVAGLDMVQTLHEMPEYFAKFGGHPQACGFTLASTDALQSLASAFRSRVFSSIRSDDMVPMLAIDAELPVNEATQNLADEIARLAPFGMDNPEPRFLARGATIFSVEPVGADGKHLRIVAGQNGVARKFIGFGFGKRKNELIPGARVDIVYELGTNHWNGNRELQLKIVDFK